MSYYEKRIAELEARVAQLAREQRLKAIPVEAKLLERYAETQAENARLKADVEELTHDANEADQQYEHAISRVRRLEAEVERLRKAGDVMLLALWLEDDEYCKEQKEKAEQAWEKAKEGKQS